MDRIIMGAFGLDYTYHSSDQAAWLASQDVHFVFRYISPGTDWKDIRKDEYDDLVNHGIVPILNYEYDTQTWRGGYDQGARDAQRVAQVTDAMGYPENYPVPFSVDWDASPGDQDVINAYLDGAGNVLGNDRVGIYGSFWVVKRCLDSGRGGAFAWQTYAWSGGNLDSRRSAYQYQNNVQIENGWTVDRNDVLWVPPGNGDGEPEIHGAIAEHYNAVNGIAVLGRPTNREQPCFDGQGRWSSFENGVIYWHPAVGAHMVYGEIFKEWDRNGRENGYLGYPVTDEFGGDNGTRQTNFQHGWISWNGTIAESK